MRVAVIGAGAIGTVAAASAAAAGHDVVVCVRSPLGSLVLVEGGVDRPVDAQLATSPDALASAPGWSPGADVVVVAVKVPDTAGTAPWLARLCGPETLVLSLQNGLDHVERLSPLVPAGTVVPAVVYIASERVGPGRVVHHFANRIVLPSGPASDRLTAALGPGLQVSTTDDFTTEAWRKLVGNAVVNPLTALTLRRVGVMAEPALAPLVGDLVTEAVAVGRAAGAALGDDDVTSLLATYEQWAGQTSGSSMYSDRVTGRPLEHEALTGAVVAAGARLGVPTPLHAALLALLRVLDPAAEVLLPDRG